jgi:hypothetical protein
LPARARFHQALSSDLKVPVELIYEIEMEPHISKRNEKARFRGPAFGLGAQATVDRHGLRPVLA